MDNINNSKVSSLFFFLFFVLAFSTYADENPVVESTLESSLLTPDQKAQRIARSALGLGRLQVVEQDLLDLEKQSPTSSITHYWLGMLFREKQSYHKSVEQFKQCVDINPANLKARIEYAKALALTKEFPAAEMELKQLLGQLPNNESALYELASIYLQQGKLDHAIKEFRYLISYNPGHPKSQEAASRLNILNLKLAEQLANQLSQPESRQKALLKTREWVIEHNFKPANWLLEKYLAKFSNDAEANYLLAVVEMWEGKYHLAALNLRASLSQDSNNVDYLKVYGRALSKINRLDAALTNLRKARDLSSNKSKRKEIEQQLGLVEGEKLAQLGKYPQALRHYLTMLSKDSTNLELMNRVANIYLQMGKTKNAEQFLRQVLHEKRSQAAEKILLQQAKVLMAKGDYKNAEVRLKNILQFNPSSSQAHYWLSVVYQRQNKLSNAAQSLQASVAFEPGNIQLRIELGKLLVKTGQYKEAIKLYDGLADNSRTPAQKKDMFLRLKQFVQGQYLLKQGHLRQALSHYQNMELLFPKDILVGETLAGIYLKFGLYEEAKDTYINVLRLDDHRAMTHLRLASIYVRLNQPENSLEQYEKAMRDDPFGKTGKFVRQSLIKGANANLKKNHLQAAENDLKTVLKVYKNDVFALGYMALIMEGEKKYKVAEKYFLQVIQFSPANFKLRMEFAQLYTEMREYDKAIAVYEKVYALSPLSEEGKGANANLDIVYNAKADMIIKNLKTKEDQQKATETARIWIQEKHRYDPAQRILNAVLALDDQNAQAHYWLATLYDRYRKFDKSIYQAAVSVSLAPQNLQLLTAFGQILARADNLDTAESIYRKVVQEARGTRLAATTAKLLTLIRAQRLVIAKHYVEALAMYQNMYTGKANEVDILARIASVYLSMGNLEKAERDFNKVLKVQPNSPSVYMELARLYDKNGDKEANTNALIKVAILDPKGELGHQAQNMLGLSEALSKLQQKKWQEAISLYKSVLKYVPESYFARSGLGSAYLGAKKFKDAEKIFYEIIVQDPSNLEARVKIARVYVGEHRTEAAVRQLQRVVAISKETKLGKEAVVNLTNIYKKRGALLLKKRLADAAVLEYRKVLAINPEDWEAHFALGRIFQGASLNARGSKREEYLKLAVSHYEETIRIKNDNYNAYVNVAKIYEIFQEYAKARDAYAHALALYTEDKPEVLANLINMLRLQVVRMEFAKNNYAWSVKELESMIEMQPKSSKLYFFLSTVHLSASQIKEGIAALLKGVDLTPDNLGAKFRLGQLYEQDNDLERAAAQYRSIVYSDQSNSIVGAARERLSFVEERLQIITFRLNYSTAYSNNWIEKSPKTTSFASTLRIDMLAHFRLKKNVNLSFNASPTYITYHETENDSLIPLYGVTGDVLFRNGSLSANFNQSRTTGLLQQVSRGETKSASLTGSWRLHIPLLLSEDVATPDVVQFRLGGNEFNPPKDFTYYNIRTLSATGIFVRPFSSGGTLSVNYTYSDTFNLVPFGSDYAKYSHTVGITVARPLARLLSAYISTNVTYDKYKNFDTLRYSSTPIKKHRITGQGSITMGLNYQLHHKLGLFMDVSYIEQRTDMPRETFIYNSQGIKVGLKSGLLTDSRNFRINAGMQFQF